MSIPLKILILNYEFPPLGGGAGVALRYLLRGLSDTDNVQVDVVTSSTNHDRVETFSKNITIHFLDIGKSGSLHYQSKKELLTYSFRAFVYSRKLNRRRNYHLIHAFFGIPCGYIAMKLGLPYVVSLRGSDVPFYNPRFETLDRLLFSRLSRTIWRRSAKVVANSEGLRRLAIETAPDQPIAVVYNAVDTAFFTPKSRSSESGAPKSSLSIVSTGRLIPRKGYPFLIEAVKNLSDVSLTIIGDGTDREALDSLARQHGVTVSFPGQAAREDVRDFLQAADIFALPSLNEGMSNAILEAMACGLPIIATDVGGSQELIRGNGVIVAKENPGAIEEAIRGYLSDSNRLEKHRKASRRIACSMSIASLTRKYLALYADVATAPDRPAPR